MAAWSYISRKLMTAAATVTTLVAVEVVISMSPFLGSCETEAGARRGLPVRHSADRELAKEQLDRFRRTWDDHEREVKARWEKLRNDLPQQRALPEDMGSPPIPRNTRRVRRFQWESPAEVRGRLWNVPEDEDDDALETALLRVCLAEADGHPQDCVGIWQVVRNNRRRSCDRNQTRRITECVEGEGETHLSSLRRHQRHVLGMIRIRNRRAGWISKLSTDCEMPEGYPMSQDHWDAHYGSKVCPQAVADVRRLVSGELPESRPGHRIRWLVGHPITWGGRCESGRGACDDRIACGRGLARIPDTGTVNAFWCRPGTESCPGDIDPVCIKMGYPSLRSTEPEVTSSRDENS